MCSIQDRLDRFFVPESRNTGFFLLKTEYNWMVNKCTPKIHQMYFKGHVGYNGF